MSSAQHHSETTAPEDQTIVSAAIYPPIGVMRVGSSRASGEAGYFIGPEVPTPVAQAPDFYRDSTGALKRQAARFRIYGYNQKGEVVKELTQDDADIIWQVHLANQKSSWYEFIIALDIPEASSAPPSYLRNAKQPSRSGLLIDGKSQQLSSGNLHDHDSAKSFVGQFCLTSTVTGESKTEDVYLGEMRLDDKGRLLMLGGHGVSKNPFGNPATTFGNNDDWYDDMSDGPVTATVKLKTDGNEVAVKPAWVVCAPPDYAPMQKSVRTMWDLMRDVAVTGHLLPRPAKPSFTHDILPIFQRMTDLQWVNAGFSAGFGWNSSHYFHDREWIERANSTAPMWTEWRRTLFNNFRSLELVITGDSDSKVWDPSLSALSAQQWPWLYGDAMDVKAIDSPRQFSTITPLQINFLEQWVKGEFIADYGDVTPYCDIEQVPVAEQPDLLTQAAMDFCLADAFHPGCEMTWPMRTLGMYSEAFRLYHANDTSPSNGCFFGPQMTPEIITQTTGPLLRGQTAGSITRWMAIPWQTDTASCRDGYNDAYGPYLPTFWPARVPNTILNQSNYEKVLDKNLPEDERQAAFNERQEWLDDLPCRPHSNYQDDINDMVTHFDKLAVVLPQTQDVTGDFPDVMQVGELAKGQTPADCDTARARKQKAQLAAVEKAAIQYRRR